jgi:hypothetical protein
MVGGDVAKLGRVLLKTNASSTEHPIKNRLTIVPFIFLPEASCNIKYLSTD